MEKVKCEICNKEFYMSNPDAGCPHCEKEDSESNNCSSTTNGKSTMCKIFATIILIGGFISSFILGVDKYGDLLFGSMLAIWLLSGVCSLFFVALGEIIQKLHNIEHVLKK